MLSATHATVLNSLTPRVVRAYACQHLNGSSLVAGTFDPQRIFRAFAVNTRGELLTLVTPHENRINICRVCSAQLSSFSQFTRCVKPWAVGSACVFPLACFPAQALLSMPRPRSCRTCCCCWLGVDFWQRAGSA